MARLTIRSGLTGFAVLTALLLGLSARAAAELKPPEAIAALNQQRAAAGIPAGISENADWSHACALHNHYMAKTGDFGHQENPSSPYYSEDGAWAGRHSVLSPLDRWDSNPFETAPIHLSQLLAPQLSVMGISGADGSICATTWPGYARPAPPSAQVYSYPGDGATDVPYAETAAEAPFIPGDFVGLPQGTTTGPYLIVYVDLPQSAPATVKLTSASMTGPDGPVGYETIDSRHDEVGYYLPYYTAFLIPRKPLEPQSSYEVEVMFSDPSLSYDFSFTTALAPPPFQRRRPRFHKAQQRGQVVRLTYKAPARQDGFDLTAIQSSKTIERHVAGSGVVRTELRLSAGWWMLLAKGESGGRECKGILVEGAKDAHRPGGRWLRLKARPC